MKALSMCLWLIIALTILTCENDCTIRFVGETMGTTYSIIIVDKIGIVKDRLSLKLEINSLLNSINHHFSTYISNSEINIFNAFKSTKPFEASPELLEIVKKSLEFYKLSNGSFDITVQSIVSEWGFSADFNISMLPDSSKIDSLLLHSGSDKLFIDQSYLYKKDPLLQIDASAIAKGWGVDAIGSVLDKAGLINYLIEIGGEILVSGTNENNEKWAVGIRNPDEYNIDHYSTIYVSNKAVATSGTYNNYFTFDSNNYSHLINPHTGYPIQHELVSATIIAENCTTADAIATAVMVKGMGAGINWVNSLENIEGLFIARNREGEYFQKKSKGFNY